jgi:hypothetical protein
MPFIASSIASSVAPSPHSASAHSRNMSAFKFCCAMHESDIVARNFRSSSLTPSSLPSSPRCRRRILQSATALEQRGALLGQDAWRDDVKRSMLQPPVLRRNIRADRPMSQRGAGARAGAAFALRPAQTRKNGRVSHRHSVAQKLNLSPQGPGAVLPSTYATDWCAQSCLILPEQTCSTLTGCFSQGQDAPT